MKKCLLLLSIVSFCFLFNANAQIKKGAVLLGGDLGFSNQKSSIVDSVVRQQRDINVRFVYGKAIRENLIFGGSVAWGNQHIDQWNKQYVYNMNSWELGVFLRKYKQLGNSGFSVFAEGNLGGQYIRQKSTSFANQTKINGWGARLVAYPGISFAVSKKLQLETGLNNFLQLSYGTSTTHADDPATDLWKTSSFSFTSSIDNLTNLYLGFRILLN